jgi:alkanesulfonate monooxygenase SsuD/methylene tetrahydromethanopterin reductase-like flavin-dependent oxidoreductase (luciferase family)
MMAPRYCPPVPLLKAIDFDLRHPPQFGVSGKELYTAALDMISWAEDHGFGRVTFGEHHQSPDGYLPTPLVFAAAVGARTSRIRIRVSVLLAPLYDPVRLAEEVAVADLCTGGRLDLGMGVGYVEDDFDAFGADYHCRGSHLEWLVPFLRQAWTGAPFEFRGTTVTVTPRPVQDPMPIHLGGGTRASIDRAVRLADGFFAPAMQRPWEHYRKGCLAAGKPDPGEWPKRGPIFLWVTTGDKEQAWEQLAPHIRHQIDSYGGWTTSGLGRPDGPFVPTRDIDSLSQGGAYAVVDPDEAVAIAHELGPDGELHLNPLLAGIAPALAWAMLETVGQHVLPHI